MKHLIKKSLKVRSMLLVITIIYTTGCQEQKDYSKELKPLTDKYNEAWQTGNVDGLDEVFDPNFEDIREKYIRPTLSSFPDIKHEYVKLLIDDDIIAMMFYGEEPIKKSLTASRQQIKNCFIEEWHSSEWKKTG